MITVKNQEKTFTCQTYDSKSLATPKNGDALEVRSEGKICYLGLSPTITEASTPLTVTKNGVLYYIERYVLSYVNIAVKASEHQTITFICNGVTNTIKEASKVLSLPVGYNYSASLSTDYGYISEGLKGINPKGKVIEAIDGGIIYTEEAKKNTYKVTINNPEGATIVVYADEVANNKTFEAEYETPLEFSFSRNAGYSNGNITVNGSTTLPEKLESNITVTVKGISLDKCIITLSKGTGVKSVTMKVDGKEISSGSKVSYGSTLEVTAEAEDGYADPTISFNKEV